MANSGAVASGAQATATQYNNLRADVLDPTTGHVHDGTNGALLGGAKSAYGDGSDGDVTISGTTSMTRDTYYNNLTVNAGQTLWVNGWRIFVKGTLTLNGTIATPWLVNSGQTGGGPPSGAGYGKLSTGGGQAGAWQPGAGSGGAAFTMGGIGGRGGDAGAYTATPCSVITGSGDYYGPHAGGPLLWFGAYMTGNIGMSPMAAGMGGGGGSCVSGYAGGGGHGGGWIMVFARRIVISATGAMKSRGGDGAPGSTPTSGGGGGGSGGCIVLTYDSLSNVGTISCPGGNGGAGAGIGTAGSTGGAGVVMYFQQ
jgi:hypothetical protein